MSLPANLGYGLVSIYGKGNSDSVTGMLQPNAGFLFGTVDKSWPGPEGSVLIGSSVMFLDKDVFTRIVYDNTTFTLIPQDKIILVEVPIP